MMQAEKRRKTRREKKDEMNDQSGQSQVMSEAARFEDALIPKFSKSAMCGEADEWMVGSPKPKESPHTWKCSLKEGSVGTAADVWQECSEELEIRDLCNVLPVMIVFIRTVRNVDCHCLLVSL